MNPNRPSAGPAFEGTQIHPGDSIPSQKGELAGLIERLSFALGPLAVGIILDVLDAATFGPIGLCFGAIVGGSAGWILGKHEGFDRNLRVAFALCAAAYMMIPFTEAIPAATILLYLSRFFVGPRFEPVTRPNVNGHPL